MIHRILRFVPLFMRQWVQIFREEGLKELLKQKGWKVVAGIFLYYLVRDSLLYIIIPYLVINNVVQCQ